MLEKTIESPLDFKEIKPVNPKGNQSWIFIRRSGANGETPILWPLEGKSWLLGKDPHAGKDWRQEEKWTAEDKMVGWHHWLNGQEFEQAPGDGKGQGSLTCWSPWGCKESDMTEQQPNSKKPLWGGKKKSGGGRQHRSSWEKLWFLGQSQSVQGMTQRRNQQTVPFSSLTLTSYQNLLIANTKWTRRKGRLPLWGSLLGSVFWGNWRRVQSGSVEPNVK